MFSSILSIKIVKVNHVDISGKKAEVTQLDIDDYGSIITLNELELNISPNDDSLIQTLRNSSYAAIFTGYDVGDTHNNNIILANGVTLMNLI